MEIMYRGQSNIIQMFIGFLPLKQLTYMQDHKDLFLVVIETIVNFKDYPLRPFCTPESIARICFDVIGDH